MNTHIRPTFRRISDSIPVPITHTPVPPLPDDYWERRAHHAEEKLQQAQDAIRAALDWLQLHAPGRALEVLEANIK